MPPPELARRQQLAELDTEHHDWLRAWPVFGERGQIVRAGLGLEKP
ncbi:hypothetical protein [Thauera linaloolentis]|nr:hypothetical protein [Thauera linaloolentis]MCM8566552.1 hypothetical protein [Thauera linaloolentis]